MVANISITKKTTKDSNDSYLQSILALYTETTRDAFFQLGGKICEFTDLNKPMVNVYIMQRWGHIIMGEGAIVIGEVEERPREK